MARQKKKEQASEQKKTEQKKSGRSYRYVFLVLILIVFAAALFYVYRSYRTTPTSFSTFKSNFNSAQRVAIYVNGFNQTALVSTVDCSTTIISTIIASPVSHRNSSTIDYYVLNQTSCLYHRLGSGTNNYTNLNLSDCLNSANAEPSIFLNYSITNTTIIRPTQLYIAGDQKYLRECGIAPELA